ncbi:MAG: cell wall metabolism sensor histidine kinase WalK, partial [Cyanobacteria bacterium]|nr:cell wall metabolism sensor histidine kinase WalK [Cyanobacteriota bacterium]
ADGLKVVQVIVNLLSNAIKFSPPGSTIQIRCFSAMNSTVQVSISDEGRGIPESQKSAVFERFKQVNVSDQTVDGGKGLGLAICKEIVEAHGGRIWVESGEGKGTTFSFQLPAVGSE